MKDDPSPPVTAGSTAYSNNVCPSFKLDPNQIEEYLNHGVLVVDNILTPSEIDAANTGLIDSLRRRGVHSFELDDEESAMAFQKLSSTNGSGGVLDIFHDDWKLKIIATNPKLFSITQQLWKAGYSCGGQSKESLAQDQRHKWHPYGGDIDFERKGFCYIDRVGYRLPTALSEEWGDRIYRRKNGNSTMGPTTSKKKKKMRSIQRSLTPHLDCCPDAMYENTNKWRPIQCFVSLTDNLEPNTGGFEAVLGGFHQTFDQWAEDRIHGSGETGNHRDLCLGEYTHIRPKEDADVMARVCHIPVKAGSAVFWDNRIPHANAYRNDASKARAVVYTSFLPDIELNRRYVRNQLEAWKSRKPIRDQWNHIPEEGRNTEALSWESNSLSSNNDDLFSEQGKKLMGLVPW